MSGICGIMRLDGAPPEGLEAMAAHLERRGPEGTSIWRDGPVGFGHTLLATTTEALHETLPLTDPRTGCTITADVRLDNREELLTALDLADEPRVIGDGELLLRAWLVWGESCLDRLLGDFAFAVWDPRTQSLFVARDHMGMRPLAYVHLPGRLLAFASVSRAVLEAEDVPRRINEGRIADFLIDELEGIDHTSTFYQGVVRLPPAHHFTLDATGLTIQPYWRLTAGPTLHLPSDEAYAAAFREVFTEAVRCRLRSAGPVGTMLSGGMDSGSIAAIASRLLDDDGRGPLPTFSAIGPDPSTCPETRAIHAALALPNIDPHLVSFAEPEAWRDALIQGIHTLEEPFDGHMNLLRAIYHEARRKGVKVVLDGAAGDLVLTHGDRIPRLIRAFRWREAWLETQASRQFWGDAWPAWRSYLNYVRQAITPGWARRLKTRALRHWPRHGRLHLVDPAFARQVDLGERLARMRGQPVQGWPSVAARRADAIAEPFLTAGRERYDRIASVFGIEPRDPFLDRRVIAFCLSLPSDQLERAGWPKIILRHAMTGLLPAEVLWRRGKEHLGHDFSKALFDAWPSWTDMLKQALPLLHAYVRLSSDPLSANCNAEMSDVADQWEVLYLAAWMAGTGHVTSSSRSRD